MQKDVKYDIYSDLFRAISFCLSPYRLLLNRLKELYNIYMESEQLNTIVATMQCSNARTINCSHKNWKHDNSTRDAVQKLQTEQLI